MQDLGPTLTSQTIVECFQKEQPLLRKITTPFAGYIEHFLKVSSTCLVRHDRVLYSVPAQWVGQIVSVRVTAYSINIVAKNETIADHQRCFSRDTIICKHYFSILEKKPGALRHGIPFQNWDLPGIDAFKTACDRTLERGVVTGSIVLNEMRRLTEPTQPKELNACHHLKLNDEPKADFQRYDHLLGAHNVH